MYNSIIIKKKKQLNCGCYDYPFSRNRCKTHATIEDTQQRIKKAMSNQNQQHINAATYGEELEEWYKARAFDISHHPYCMETGEFIPKKYYRHATAHILPKSIFPSVATHPNNFLILSASSGAHSKFDNGGASEMKVFEEAKRRFNTFKHLVKEKHKLLNIFQ